MSEKSCGRGTSDWRVIPARCELFRKEISSERIIVSEELQARLIVWEGFWAWCRLEGTSGEALSSFSLEFSTYARDTAPVECGMDLSVVITWVGLGLSAAEPHALLFLCTCQLDSERQSVSLGQ
jgi:hypothetical protein